LAVSVWAVSVWALELFLKTEQAIKEKEEKATSRINFETRFFIG